MNLGLEGKVALVAGASRGLGLAVATQLAAEGAEVAICARGAEALGEAEAALRRVAQGRIMATVCDLRDQEARSRWVTDVAEKWGAMHIVVANASGPPSGPALSFDLQAYRDALELSLLSQIGLVQAALPYLRAVGWGRVLLIASETVERPTPRYALSSVARSGLVSFAKVLVQELGAAGITVNVLAPGTHRTPTLERMAMALAGDRERGFEQLTAHVPLRRPGRSEEFGSIAAFLASERASYIHGTVVLVDGGASAAGQSVLAGSSVGSQTAS
jgi:3-oxoacyl-[acyl-carrier protein] reductase